MNEIDRDSDGCLTSLQRALRQKASKACRSGGTCKIMSSALLPASIRLVWWDRKATVPAAASIATWRLGCFFHGRYGKSGSVTTLPLSCLSPVLRRRIARIG